MILQNALFCQSRAVFSPDRVYRYTLCRTWGGGGRHVNFVMLNPSTADEVSNDPTVERCQRRAVEWGYDGLFVTNIFALRSTDPAGLKAVDDPVGPANDQHLLTCARSANLVVCAWGNHGSLHGRSGAVRSMLGGVSLHVLKLAGSGEPCHPLYLPYSLKPIQWEAA